MHPIRSICGLAGSRVGYRLVHPTHKLEHDVVLFKREFLFDVYALDQLLDTRRFSVCAQHAFTSKCTYRRGPEEKGVILLRTIKVCSSGVAREGFDALL